TAQRAMEEAMKYGKERKQFGKAITENQAIQFRLADMQIKIEAARQLTAHVLQKMDAGMDFSTEAAMAKAFAADTAIEVTGSAMDVFGGYGFMTHFPAEKLLRDARVFQIIEGTGEMQRSVVAAHLLKEGRR
ncbi:MAG: acyl-CoA dehydrogenase, partial [Firmicutes bacterium]|nr:acyl-CoA dehydrogenase [Bacillota bacterium]